MGRPKLIENRLTTYLKKDEKNNIVYIAPQTEEGSKEAILDYSVLSTKNKLSLLEVSLITGRSHQIRVQMAKQLNTPIYADIKYGDEEHIGNLALWAYQLEFVHPVTKEIMKFRVAPDYKNIAFKMFASEIEKLLI